MTTQTLIKIVSNLSPFNLILHPDDPAIKNDPFSAAGIGYEISSEELGNAMTAPIPGDLIDTSTLQVSPDEFDTIYHWFIS
jgi:hypothetical protein